MLQSSKTWTNLCVLTALQGLALFLFASGFFLTRLELPNTSPCDPSSLLEAVNATDLWVGRRGSNNDTLAGCWGPRYYARVVVLLVDGLRYDFVAPTASTPSPPTSPRTDANSPMPGESENRNTMADASMPPKPIQPLYLDRMPTVKALLARDPTGTRLAVFEADPPTTTSQRLKGLTTGGMPTFLDLRKNFNSPAVSEDSWIGQLNAAAARAAREPIGATKDATQPTDNPIRHKRYHHFSDGSSPSHSWGWGALLLGDDTWTSLYPNHFDAKASLPMASFDTRDLHTVDEAVSLCLGPLIDVSLAQEDTCSSFPAKNAAPSTPVDTTANAGANTMPPNGKSQPSSEPWAVMIAHFLGVDHVGHTHRADHPVMAAKLTQMDEVLRSTVARLESEFATLRHRISNCVIKNVTDSSIKCNSSMCKSTDTGEVVSTSRTGRVSDQDVFCKEAELNKGGPTLVLMFGDHGMTEDGNHGGATEAETHAGFFAWEARLRPMTSISDAHSKSKNTYGNQGRDRDNNNDSAHQYMPGLPVSFASEIWKDADGWGDNSRHRSVNGRNSSRSGPSANLPDASSHRSARRANLAQVDLVPSLSLLLGLPVPASSLGGVWPELFTLPAVQANFRNRFHREIPGALPTSSSLSNSQSPPLKSSAKEKNVGARPVRVPWSQHPLSQALLVNAAQVWAYLLAYNAASMGFPEGVLDPLQQQLYSALHAHRKLATAEAEEAADLRKEVQAQMDEEAEEEAEALWLSYRAFLGAALALGRRLFTRFDGSLMASGLTILSVVAVTAVFFLFRALLHRIEPTTLLSSPLKIGSSNSSALSECTSALQSSIALIAVIFKAVVIPVGCCLLHTSGRFANSFVESEAMVLCFLNGTAALATGLYAAAGEGINHTMQTSPSERSKRSFSAAAWGIVAAVAVRLTAPGGALRATSNFDPLLADTSIRASCASGTEEVAGRSTGQCSSQDSTKGEPSMLWLLWFSCGTLVILSAFCDNYLSAPGTATGSVLSFGAVGENGEATEIEARRQRKANLKWRIRWATVYRRFLSLILWFLVGYHWQLERDNALQIFAAGDKGSDSNRGAQLHHYFVQLELRLLLPRVLFALAIIHAASFFSFNSSSDVSFETDASVVVWRLHQCAHVGLAFLPFWVFLLGPSGPGCAVALLVHAIATVALSATFAEALLSPSSTLSSPPPLSSSSSSPLAAQSIMATAEVSKAVARAGGAICAAVLCRLGARHAFHASGHGNTFSDLQLGAAFVGFDNFWAPRAGFLLFTNTVGAELLWSAAVLPASLAAVVLATSNIPDGLSPMAKQSRTDTSAAVKTAASTDADVLEVGLYASAVLQSVDCLATVTAVAVHRRHLMVWAIFAPKLVLDAAMHAAHASAVLFSAWSCSTLNKKNVH